VNLVKVAVAHVAIGMWSTQAPYWPSRTSDWTEARRHMGREPFAEARLHPIESENDDPSLPTEPTA
jgi:hypothetical protein